MLFILLMGKISFNSTLIIFLIAIYFLSGFGTPLGISTFVIFVLNRFETRFSGKEKGANINRFLLLITIFLIGLLIYEGPYNITLSILHPGASKAIVDWILYVYGIASLFLTIYIIPLLKKTFFVSTTIEEKDIFKKTVKEAFQGLKTRLQSWRKQYAKVELQKQLSLKEQLKEVQRHIAIFTMVFLGIGCLIFTPLFAIFIFIWLRIYLTYTSKRPLKFEIILLLIASIVIMVLALLQPFIPELKSLFTSQYYNLWINIAEFAGVLISSLLYFNYLLKPILQERRKRKIEDLKKASADLKKASEDLKKQHADLKKEHDDLKQSTKYLLKKKRELEKKVKETKPEKSAPKS